MDAPPNVRYRGKSGHGADLSVCPLMTQSRHPFRLIGSQSSTRGTTPLIELLLGSSVIGSAKSHWSPGGRDIRRMFSRYAYAIYRFGGPHMLRREYKNETSNFDVRGHCYLAPAMPSPKEQTR